MKANQKEVPVDGYHQASASGQELCPSKEGTFMGLIIECQKPYCSITLISIRREE
jgi:hypothetical protein